MIEQVVRSLQKRGYDVWWDLDRMKGSTMDAMSDASQYLLANGSPYACHFDILATLSSRDLLSQLTQRQLCSMASHSLIKSLEIAG